MGVGTGIQIVFKICLSFTNCMTDINNTRIYEAGNIDVLSHCIIKLNTATIIKKQL